MANSPSSPAAVKPAGNLKTITLGMMTIMIITSIVSTRGFASQAEYGWTSIFYYLLAAIVFLIPYSLVCAELASTYTKSGGVFRWVGEGLGPLWGWFAMYLDWIMIVIWFPAELMFGSNAVAFIWWPESFDNSLANNKIYTLVILLVVYWVSTFNTFRGMKSANKLSTIGGLFGTIIPCIILIIMGIVYVVMGKPINIPDTSFFPNFSKFGNIVLATSIFLFYAGMEIQAVHITSMKNPSKTFPISVLVSVVAILLVFIGCTLAIGFVIPQKDINLLATLFVAYKDLFATIHCPWLGNILAVFIAFGVIGQCSVIIAGPSTGLLAVGRAGYLPKGLQKVNKNDIQVNILWVQGIIVSVLSLILVILPEVQSAYQVLSQMSTILYLIMVVVIYVAFVWLRHTEPNAKRGFKVPAGGFGKWFIAILGIVGAMAAMILSFVPPAQIPTGSPAEYVLILIAGVIIFALLPFWMYAKRKKSWKDPTAHFEPFEWQIEGRKPSQVSDWDGSFAPPRPETQAELDDLNSKLSDADDAKLHPAAHAAKVAAQAQQKAAAPDNLTVTAQPAAQPTAQADNNEASKAAAPDKGNANTDSSPDKTS